MAVMGAAFVFSLASNCDAESMPLNLNILPNGHVRFENGPELDQHALRAKIENLMRTEPHPYIRIVPDRHASYDAVAKVLRAFQQMNYGAHFGFTGISK